MLQWARAQEPTCPWNSETCKLATLKGYLDDIVVQWQWARAQDYDARYKEEPVNTHNVSKNISIKITPTSVVVVVGPFLGNK